VVHEGGNETERSLIKDKVPPELTEFVDLAFPVIHVETIVPPSPKGVPQLQAPKEVALTTDEPKDFVPPNIRVPELEAIQNEKDDSTREKLVDELAGVHKDILVARTSVRDLLKEHQKNSIILIYLYKHKI